jgi:hypothetical protein
VNASRWKGIGLIAALALVLAALGALGMNVLATWNAGSALEQPFDWQHGEKADP